MSSNQDNIYQSFDSDADHAIARWSFIAQKTGITTVVPDGCCDIIIVNDHSSRSPTWFVSELSNSVYDVDARAGQEMFGIRLEPGVQIDRLRLNQWMKTHNANDLLNTDQVDEFCRRSSNLTEALKCLCVEEIESVSHAASQLGVSNRTLQRLIKAGTQRPPYFWFSLARVRRTAKALNKFDRLVDVAAVYRYSDQAHMTRELSLWLGKTPTQIKEDTKLLSLLEEPGYV